ncbi:HAD family hydrolase [Streptococcus salivarius]|uniref:HAD family hydrolase n=2 Tax=Streptococcus salivarius TaxID=1304 RepID=UPI00211D091B|nr:HAD family hydrolase [Streptococcus salivarius]
MKEFFITDFDGTVNFDSAFETTTRILDEIKLKYELVIATGRNYEDFFAYFPEELKYISKFMVFSNGSVVLKDGNISHIPLKEKIIKFVLSSDLVKGLVLFELPTGEKFESEFLTENMLDKVTRVQFITNSEDDYIWNLNLLSNLDCNVYTPRVNNISIYPSNVSKFLTSNKFIGNDSIVKKVMGNGTNDISMLMQSNVKYLYVTDKVSIEEIIQFIRE